MRDNPLIRTEYGPLVLDFPGHDSVEAYDREAGRSGQCLADADAQLARSATVHTFSEAFYSTALSLTGIERGLDEARTARKRAASPNPEKITPYKEPFSRYLNRVFESVSPECQAEIKLAATALALTIPISAVSGSRLLPISPTYFVKAQSILSNTLETINSKVSKFKILVPNYILDLDEHEKPTVESLARLISEYEELRLANQD